MALMELTDEEILEVLCRRKENYDKNRPLVDYKEDCCHIGYDADGDFCELRKGYGVNGHCWARAGRECKSFTPNHKK